MTDQPLPSFLKRDDHDALTLTLHCTGIQTYKVCPQEFWLTEGLEIERATPKWAQNYGGALHAALGYRYAHQELSIREVEEAQVRILEAWFAEPSQCPPDDEWRNLVRACNSVRAYNARWPAHEWTVLAVEEPFECLVGHIESGVSDACTPRTQVAVRLAGRKDLVVALHEGVWVVDHKTASEWGDNPDTNQELLAGRRSFQFRGYCWHEREQQRQHMAQFPILKPGGIVYAEIAPKFTLPVKGAIGNYIVGRKPFSESAVAVARRRSDAKPRDDHFQEYFVYDDAQLDEWRDEFLLVAARILRDWQAGAWERSFDRGCAYYGKCPFYDYCEESPATREATLSTALYRHRETRGAILDNRNGDEA